MGKIATYAKPITLYRYRALSDSTGGSARVVESRLNREVRAIRQHSVYCSTYTEMNDPMEGFYRATERVEQSADYEAVSADIRAAKLRLGIASFCETWNNELMWAHYAGGFVGICVGYRVTRLVEGLSASCSLARVMYGDRPFSLTTRRRRSSIRAREVLSTKNLKWAYEREWRLFAPTPGLAHHGPGVVTHLYFGARIPRLVQLDVTRRLRNLNIEMHATTVDGYAVKIDRDVSF